MSTILITRRSLPMVASLTPSYQGVFSGSSVTRSMASNSRRAFASVGVGAAVWRPTSSTPGCSQFRAFATTLTPRLPHPSNPVKRDRADEEPSFQPHPADIAPVKPVSNGRTMISSRPYEDWVVSHPVYSSSDVDAVKVVRHPRPTFGDKLAGWLVAVARKGFDLVTGYKHASPEAARQALAKAGKEDASVQDLIKDGYIMSVDQWLARILFLESIAGVPGMVAGTLRHLRSLRMLRRDGGWINTLLQEAENERMHLMTFMKIKNPSLFFRMIILGAQGVFYNAFFLAYILSPRSAHRFVGCLEEEACLTYTQIIDEIERGHIPEWDHVHNPSKATKVPGIALDYWRLPTDSTMLDLIKQVRADEAGHRFTNHTLANLDYKTDHNPLGFRHASAQMQGEQPGMSRQESLEWLKKVETEMRDKIDSEAKVGEAEKK